MSAGNDEKPVAPAVIEAPTPVVIEDKAAPVMEAKVPEAPAPTVLEEKAPPVVEAAVPSASAAPMVETPALAAAKASESSWFSTASSPWDTVAQKASQLASTWDAPVTTQPAAAEKPAAPTAVAVEAPAPAVIEEKEAPAVRATAPEVVSPAIADVAAPAAEANQIAESVKDEVTLPPAAVEAIREEVSHYSGENIVDRETATAGKSAKDAAPAKTESHDDLVAKVLAKMSPEMLQAVTREILKPVVEAMVKEELDSKKK
jgi:hypothetical protein